MPQLVTILVTKPLVMVGGTYQFPSFLKISTLKGQSKKKIRSHDSTFVEFDYTFYFVNTQCRDPTRLNNTIPEIKCESPQAPGGRVYNSSEKISLNFFENYSPTDSICIFFLSLQLEE